MFDASVHTEKRSFGVYVERGERGFYLTVWDSDEVQLSTVDYTTDASPRERHLSDADANRLGTEFEQLIGWLGGNADQG
ncbi:hypothetical protein GCM10027075_58850 [Streptomyces heilongjiangensis]